MCYGFEKDSVEWGKHVVVACLYCVSLIVFRWLSISHWIILTGFHLSVLLLSNYKYWPALLVGEIMRLGYISFTCLSQFGLAWALVNLIPSILWMMPVVWIFREHGYLFLRKYVVNMENLLLCSFLISLIATLVSLGQILITPLPTGYVIQYGEVSGRLMLGNFLGVLTITPSVLVLHKLLAKGRSYWAKPSTWPFQDRDLFSSVFLVTPLLLFLIWVGVYHFYIRMLSQTAMFIPVVWLALRHGWRGAALSGTLASVGSVRCILLMSPKNNYSTLEVETLIAVAISTMLIVGARIALLDKRVSDESAHARTAMALARRNAQVGETRLRTAAVAMEQVRETAHDVFKMMLLRLRHLQPAIDDAGYRRHVSGAQDRLVRLADNLYPTQLHGRSLPVALREGAIARVLQEAGVAYTYDIRGPISLFSQALHITLYRLVCEAVAQVCADKGIADIRVRIRCGCHAKLWLVVQVDAGSHPVGVHFVRWDELLTQLHQMTAGLDRRAMEDRVATFDGRFRERTWRGRKRISLLLLDPGDCA